MYRLASCSTAFIHLFFKQHFATISNITSRAMATAAEQHRDHQVNTSGTVIPNLETVRVPYRHTFASVGYADLGPKDGPVCLTLHGAPGGIQDTIELADSLNKAGIRLLIPEFPEYGRTTLEHADVFDHSTSARTELIKNFLTTINIPKVAAVVGHSMGVATALNLASGTDICQSFVSLSGICTQPHRTLKPYWFLKTVASILENKWIGSLSGTLLARGYKARGFNFSDDEPNGNSLKVALVSSTRIDFDQHHCRIAGHSQPLHGAVQCHMQNEEFSLDVLRNTMQPKHKLQIANNAARLRTNGMPMLFALTQSDRLVEWELSVKTARQCGVEETNFTWFDSEEKIIKGPSIDDHSVTYPRALVFERGGHFVHRSHTDIVSSAIVDLIKFTVKEGTNHD